MPAVLLAAGLVLVLPGGYAGEANHAARQFANASDCSSAIGGPAGASAALRGSEFSLVSWNIEKGVNSGWRRDLRRLSQGAQLVLLQEAVLSDEMMLQPDGEVRFWSFSPGYQTAEIGSGVMTLSQAAPDVLCSLQHDEPWLNTPKAASITRFSLADADQDLLLVNVHQINFTIGLDDFSRQLDDLATVMAQHQGPLVLSGDFNTWKQSRLDLLMTITSRLGLGSVAFIPDHRKTFMGNPLDHIFIRGLEVTDSYTEQVRSSDHNPLIIKLALRGI